MYATVNRRLGVVGGFSDVVERLSERRLRVGWRGSFLVGLVGRRSPLRPRRRP
jgi:hypothetical protein